MSRRKIVVQTLATVAVVALLCHILLLSGSLQGVPLQKGTAAYIHVDREHFAQKLPFSSPPRLSCPKWQNVSSHVKEIYNLAEVLQVRVYEDDKAKWTTAELKQWMHYLFWAGVDHILVCDHYKYEHEKLDKPLIEYIKQGLVTYFPWGHSSISHAMKAQVACYQLMIDKYKDRCKWQMAIDMDEFPYKPDDTTEGFLVRYLASQDDKVSELSMHNFLLLGQGDRKKNMTFERINRITPQPANNLDKPIYKPGRVSANLHHNIISKGITHEVPNDELKMLHYWGARMQDWGPDTPELFKKTVEFNSVRDTMAPRIRKSLLCYGEFDAFSSKTGP